ncbi:MAG: extensin family protein [Rhodobacteraceae bacterium]|nr:extensin family protein [Paracoccaceae bacterium]
MTEGAKGALCGDPGIAGESIAPVVSRVRGCGIPVAVKVTAVAGVRLSTPATIDCPTAIALKNWVQTGLKPAVGTTGGGVATLTVFGSYECRPVDDIRGAKLSLHAQGKAIDIGGFTLANGKAIMVASDWRKPGDGKLLKTAYHAACGIFGTTLGPDGDRFHQTHMHFDTAHYNGGAYCH